MTQAYSKPLPTPQVESDVYWQKAKEHELWLRYDNDAQQYYFYPRDISPITFSRNTEWRQVSGKATLYTYAIVHRAPHPGFVEDVPFVTALVELDEGPIMPTNIVMDDPTPEKLVIGMPLEVVFEDVTDDISLPKFKPA